MTSYGPDALVIGAGPAGLIAAEVLAAAGRRVVVADRMRFPGRKFVLAGRGGLNLTHSEALEHLLRRYQATPNVRGAIVAFDPAALRAWADGLGEPTFVGSSGRVFPESFRATRLLRAWLRRLDGLGVEFRLGHRFVGWTATGVMLEASGETTVMSPRVTLLALGGASWSGTGSDGGWVEVLRGAGISVNPLRPTNCGFLVDWSESVRSRFAGTPLKNVTVTAAGQTRRGEAMVTMDGIEGGAIYALSAALREEIDCVGSTTLIIDLRPDLALVQLTERLTRAKARDSLANVLRKGAGLSPVGAALVREAAARRTQVAPDPPPTGAVGAASTVTLGAPPVPREPSELAALIKAVPIVVSAPMPLSRAISSAGGVAWSEIDGWMLRRRPGTFVAGEMLDWEAPTGGYLLQGAFSTGVAAAHAMLDHLDPPG